MATVQHLFDTLRLRWRSQSMLLKLVVVNAAVFVLLRLCAIVGLFAATNVLDVAMRLVEMPSSLTALASRPWTVITYMFTQYDVLHLLFNMLWLYWFGLIFMSFSTPRRLMGLYLYGGIGGAFLYLVAYNLMPVFADVNGMLLGSSASVISIVTATAVIWPEYRMNLLFIGAVALKWVALVTIGLDLISVTGSNAGGHIAHLGGALVGLCYGLAMRRGHDITSPINRLIDQIVNLFKHKPRFRKTSRVKFGQRPNQTAQSPRTASRADQEELDRILDKIKTSGYTSLTQAEKTRLFDVSRKIK